MEKPHFQIIVGSIREGRKARPVGDWAYEFAAKRGDMSVELLDLKEWNLPLFDFAKPPILGDYENPMQRQWAEKIRSGDGYLLVSPEYNHGYSPVLKNALDYLYSEWNHKPASFITYGGVAGARGGEQLRLVMIELRMAPLRNAVHIQNAGAKFKDGRFVADNEDIESLTDVLNDLIWWGKALRNARAQ